MISDAVVSVNLVARHFPRTNRPRSPQVPRTKFLRQQEDRRGNQDTGSAERVHFDAGRSGVGDLTRHDSDPRDNQATPLGRELCVKGCGVDGGGEGRDAKDPGLDQADREPIQ